MPQKYKIVKSNIIDINHIDKNIQNLKETYKHFSEDKKIHPIKQYIRIKKILNHFGTYYGYLD